MDIFVTLGSSFRCCAVLELLIVTREAITLRRSLVALSLILSLLLFKPAPIYILDEVDAALDLSHTQNIGQMLRTHFQQSQARIDFLWEIGFTHNGDHSETSFKYRPKCVMFNES